jgi:DNA-binding MarR family transcriptional regulator
VKNDCPQFDATNRCDLLRTITSPYPEVDPEVISIVAAIQSISRTISAKFSADLDAHDLTEGKFYVLAFLRAEEIAGHPDPSPSDIAEHLDVTRGTITGLLDGLERDGYLERLVDQADRRALTIRMSDKARHFLGDFLPEKGASLTRTLCLSDSDKQALKAALARVDFCLTGRVA